MSKIERNQFLITMSCCSPRLLQTVMARNPQDAVHSTQRRKNSKPQAGPCKRLQDKKRTAVPAQPGEDFCTLVADAENPKIQHRFICGER